RGVDRERAGSAGRANLFHRLDEALEAFAQFWLTYASGVRQLEPACASVKQLYAQHVLQTLDLVAHCSRRYVQFRRGARKARQACGSLESPKGIQRWKPSDCRLSVGIAGHQNM